MMDMRREVRRFTNRLLLGEQEIALTNQPFALEPHLAGLDEFGLYLHIPFCRQICPYCPYNKELYTPQAAEAYTQAVIQEIDGYAALLGNKPVTSFYIGGGTPTSMLHSGLACIVGRIQQSFNLQCAPHLESHPNDLSQANLDAISALGVEYLSIGVEALQDHHLRRLGRNYTAVQARQAIRRAVAQGFRCVNVDLIFALPDQTHAELRQAAQELIELGVHQVAAYPLFTFPYTRWQELQKKYRYRHYTLLEKRSMLAVLEDIFYNAGYQRSSVWAFTRQDVPRYCSVTVPLYLGLGASAGSYLKDIFYLNTFNVAEYIRTMGEKGSAIALSLPLNQRRQMAGWLYWRIYETHFRKDAFPARFGAQFDRVYGRLFILLAALQLCRIKDGEIVLRDGGAYWLHALQDLYSIDYVSKLWGASRIEPFPERLTLA
jgi:coproporphyrinogen III oxidase-like Fe-S oxidoreductase